MNFNLEIKNNIKTRKTNPGLFQQEVLQNIRNQQTLNNNQNKQYIQNGKKSKLSSSPLKSPLENAINKVVNNINHYEDSKKNNQLNLNLTQKSHPNSSRIKKTRRIEANTLQQINLQDRQILQIIHPEALQFLKKYFSGFSSKNIQKNIFIECLMRQFSNLWSQSQAKAIMPQFIQKLNNRLGEDHVYLNKLYILTKQNGLIGLILNIFRQLKQQQSEDELLDCGMKKYVREYNESEQCQNIDIYNLKNIIEQFMQGLYKNMQNEIYNRLNVQMRRLMLKYKEGQNILKSINQKINQNIDKVCYMKKKNELQKNYQLNVQKLNQKIRNLECQLEKQKIKSNSIKLQNQKMLLQNKKLSQLVEKYQNLFLNNQIKTNFQTNIIAQQKYKSNIPPQQLYLPQHPNQPKIIPVILNYQSPQNIISPQINYNYPILPPSNQFYNTKNNNIPNQFVNPGYPIQDLSGQKNGNSTNQINDIKRGIRTVTLQKQNSSTYAQNIRCATPTKLNINKPMSSPNNIVKTRKI